VKTTGLSAAPSYLVRFFGPSGKSLGTRSIPTVASEGTYTYVSRVLAPGEVPAAAAVLNIELDLEKVSTGTAFLDDLLIEPISQEAVAQANRDGIHGRVPALSSSPAVFRSIP